MSSIPFGPGPLIAFRIDTSAIGQLNTAFDSSIQKIRAQNKQMSDEMVAGVKQYASAFDVASAKLRAGIAQESLGLDQIKNARYELLNLADREIAIYRDKKIRF